MFEASTASMMLSILTSEATVCFSVKPVEVPMDIFAYAESTAEASAASIYPSALISPSMIVTTEAEVSLFADDAGDAVLLTFDAEIYSFGVHSEAAEAAVILPAQSAKDSADAISFFALILISFILGYPLICAKTIISFSFFC